LGTAEARRGFIAKVFSLAPRDVEPPYDETDKKVLAVPLPALREVVVFCRDSFQPALQSEYEKGGRTFLNNTLEEMRQYDVLKDWFSFENVVRRVGFQAGAE